MGQFKVVGTPAPASPEAALLQGRFVGQEFDADFSKDDKQTLINAGVVEELGGAAKEEPKAAARSPRKG